MIRVKTEGSLVHKVLPLGLLVAVLMAASLLLTAKPAHANTFTVSNTDDSGNGSLRKAILDANARLGADTIKFNITGTGAKTILPASQLPRITDPVVIDGYTQPGSRPNSRATGAIDAVVLVEISAQNRVADGLEIAAPNVVVRGLAINLFGDDGIQTRDGAQGARIEGNFIGTDASGAFDRGNSFSGVEITFDGGKHIIGGTTPDKRNIISGNNKEGIAFVAGQGGNKVQGNLIGTQKDGTSPRENSEEGIEINTSNQSNNQIGGAVLGAANVIAFNRLGGVEVFGNNTGNRIVGNSIFSNGELGIDLNGGTGDNDRTLNDPKDPDTGPSNLQNFPLLSSAKTSASGVTTITGELDSTPGKTFSIQFFSNPRGEDEGKTFLGQKSVATDAQGKASFTFQPSQALSGLQSVTATATNGGGNTSEFSDPAGVVTAS